MQLYITILYIHIIIIIIYRIDSCIGYQPKDFLAWRLALSAAAKTASQDWARRNSRGDASCGGRKGGVFFQWLLLVPLKGGIGWWHSPSPNWQEKYHLSHTTYSPCRTWGGYIIPTTFYGNQKQPLIFGLCRCLCINVGGYTVPVDQLD